MADDGEKDSDQKCFKLFGYGATAIAFIVTLIVHVLGWFFIIGLYWNMALFISLVVVLVLMIVTAFLPKKISNFLLPCLLIAVLVLNFFMYWYGTVQVFVKNGGSKDEYVSLLPKANVVFVLLGREGGFNKDADDVKLDKTLLKSSVDEGMKKLYENIDKTKDSNHAEVKLNDLKIETKGDALTLWNTIRSKRFVGVFKKGIITLDIKGLSDIAEGRSVMTKDEVMEKYKDKK